jgi:hypothetical protein
MLGPDTIEAEAAHVASDPNRLRRHFAVHAAVLLLVDAPRSALEAASDHTDRVSLFVKDAA